MLFRYIIHFLLGKLCNSLLELQEAPPFCNVDISPDLLKMLVLLAVFALLERQVFQRTPGLDRGPFRIELFPPAGLFTFVFFSGFVFLLFLLVL